MFNVTPLGAYFIYKAAAEQRRQHLDEALQRV